MHNIASHVHVVLEQYLRGQLFLILLMSVVTYIVLSLGFHLPYALPIAIATGVLEIIPLFGPLVAGAIASVVAVVSGGLPVMIGVIVAYFVLRQVEDQLVMPFVVGRAVHLHPLVTIFAVLTGSAAAGVLGAVMAVPVTAGLRVVLDYVFAAGRGEYRGGGQTPALRAARIAAEPVRQGACPGALSPLSVFNRPGH